MESWNHPAYRPSEVSGVSVYVEVDRGSALDHLWSVSYVGQIVDGVWLIGFPILSGYNNYDRGSS